MRSCGSKTWVGWRRWMSRKPREVTWNLPWAVRVVYAAIKLLRADGEYGCCDFFHISEERGFRFWYIYYTRLDSWDMLISRSSIIWMDTIFAVVLLRYGKFEWVYYFPSLGVNQIGSTNFSRVRTACCDFHPDPCSGTAKNHVCRPCAELLYQILPLFQADPRRTHLRPSCEL